MALFLPSLEIGTSAAAAYLLLERGEISLDALVLALQRLHARQVTAVVVGRQHVVLLGDPRDRLVSVAVETLDLMRAEQAETKQCRQSVGILTTYVHVPQSIVTTTAVLS